MTDALCHLVVDGNDVLMMKLVRGVDDIADDETTFNPEMCHQVFGEKENIFGYTGLQIRLYYSAGSLMTYLSISYSDKIDPKTSDGLKADDIEGALRKVIPAGYISNLDEFVNKLPQEEKFRPFGTLIHSFTHRHEESNEKTTFEIYYCETSTPGFLEFHKRLQTFLLWYVDGASFIDVDDDQWAFFIVYEKYTSDNGSPLYATVGYATVYRYYAYPAHIRPRISQVLVLPPFRKMSVCANLIRAIYSHFTIQSEVIDITVEDPSPEFQRVRDYVDALNCTSLPAFSAENLRAGYSKDMEREARNKYKINKLQTRRVFEILRLRETDRANEAAYRKYRLDVKNRLNAPFQKKKLDMSKMSKFLTPEEYAATASTTRESESHERLSRSYRLLEEDYLRVIDRLDQE